MKIRLLAAALLTGAVFVPTAASANTGCQAVPGGITDPDVARGACYTAVGLVPDWPCDKYGLCLA